MSKTAPDHKNQRAPACPDDAWRIAGVEIPNRVILAPMSGVTDRPFRRLARRYGVGLVVSEMVASHEMIRQTRQSLRRVRLDEGPGPTSVQLAGTDPDVMAEAARIVVDLGADIVDINFGCPAKKVVRKATGSALMRDEPLAGAIMAAVVDAVDVPVTVKMRTGWDDDSRNAPRLARMAEDCGVTAITVHGRTRCQFYTGRADWDFIAEVVDAVSLPVVANGDIATLDDATRCLAASGADAVMVGRGAQGRPWFPGHVAAFLATGERREEPAPRERLSILREHLDAMLGHYGVDTGIRNARKHVGWYAHGIPGAAQFRDVVNNTLDPAVIERELHSFSDMVDRVAA